MVPSATSLVASWLADEKAWAYARREGVSSVRTSLFTAADQSLLTEVELPSPYQHSYQKSKPLKEQLEFGGNSETVVSILRSDP